MRILYFLWLIVILQRFFMLSEKKENHRSINTWAIISSVCRSNSLSYLVSLPITISSHRVLHYSFTVVPMGMKLSRPVYRCKDGTSIKKHIGSPGTRSALSQKWERDEYVELYSSCVYENSPGIHNNNWGYISRSYWDWYPPSRIAVCMKVYFRNEIFCCKLAWIVISVC